MTEMILPPALKPGDTIGVMAPSSYVERDSIDAAKAWIEQQGFKVFIHPQTYERKGQSAGTTLQKAMALQGLWQREDIAAIWCARGGNRAMHFVDNINFKRMNRNPKFLIGFSDVTVLLNAIYAHTGIIGLHAPVFKDMGKHKDSDLTLKTLRGELSEIRLEGAKTLNEGSAKGHLIGGNLSLFQYLPQTLPGEFWKDSILFLEDCSEEISRLDRMLLHLKRLGVLGQVNGIIFGNFSDLKDTGTPYGYSWDDVIAEHTEGLDIPIVSGAGFGHAGDLPPFPIGAKTSFHAAQESVSLVLEPYTS